MITAKILSQLDAIGKHINVMESNSVSRSRPKVKKSVCKPAAASSNLTASHGENDLQKICQTYIQCAMIGSFKSKSRIASESYLALIKIMDSKIK